MQAQVSAGMEQTALLKSQANAAKSAQALAGKRVAKAREHETSVGSAALLQDFQVPYGPSGLDTVPCIRVQSAELAH